MAGAQAHFLSAVATLIDTREVARQVHWMMEIVC
jgi:hypothetical protein